VNATRTALRWWPVLAQLLGVAAVAAGGWLVAPALGLVLGGIGLVAAGTVAEMGRSDGSG
jgi:hypothetical protein